MQNRAAPSVVKNKTSPTSPISTSPQISSGSPLFTWDLLVEDVYILFPVIEVTLCDDLLPAAPQIAVG